MTTDPSNTKSKWPPRLHIYPETLKEIVRLIDEPTITDVWPVKDTTRTDDITYISKQEHEYEINLAVEKAVRDCFGGLS